MVRRNPLTPFVFDNGEQVLIRPVSPFTLLEAKETVLKPKPPVQKVKYGEQEVEESNPAHPDYIAAMEEYNATLNRVSRDLVIKRGVVVNLDDEQRESVAELRKFWMEEYGKPLSGNDTFLYVTHFCIKTKDDIDRLINAVSSIGEPTPEAVLAAQESFPATLPGA